MSERTHLENLGLLMRVSLGDQLPDDAEPAPKPKRELKPINWEWVNSLMIRGMNPKARKSWLHRKWSTEERWRYTDALGDWLASYPWEWFGHLTFRSCQSGDYADRAVGQWLHGLSRRAYGRNYHKRAGEGLWGFCGFERQLRGDWHGHVCIAGTNGLSPLEGKRAWGRVRLIRDNLTRKTEARIDRIGRVYRYRGAGGAHYGAKYASKESVGDAFWRLYGNWRDQANLPLLAHD